MLCLSRKPGQKILIGDQIVVTIIRIGPDVVRVGVEAPGEMLIVREELAADWDPDIAPGHDHKPKGKGECDK